LVTKWVSEIKAIKVSEIVRLRDKCVWDVIGCLELVRPALSFLEGFLEVFTACFTKVFRFVVSGLIKVDFSVSLSQSLGIIRIRCGCLVLPITMVSVVGMMLLKLANVSFPS
tara:strand:- start:633 stop:968 length:336 start_codon:yes stop_codon:yes gene_type:complete